MQNKVAAAIALAMLVSGCMPIKLGAARSGSDRACLTENARFLDAWSCVRARLVSRQSDGSRAQRDGLIEEGDLLAAQVRAGKVSDSEARKRLDAGIAHEAS